MASSSCVPAASATVAKVSTASSASPRRHARLSFPIPSKPKKLILLPTKGSRNNWNGLPIAKAQLNEVVGGSSNDAAPAESKPEANGKDARLQSSSMSEEAISEFITQVSSLVKLVDSRDIVELQLKQLDCELIIRKKEALPQPPTSAPVMMMQPASSHAGMQFAPPPAAAPLPSPASASSAPPPPAILPPKSSHPPLKSPMAGTFYRSPGPGLPQFVKVGDKVNKGQVLCIIEAMKLMNEIEADQSGTVVEILAEDGKPVSVDQPLFVVQP